ncbi:uncharacterized protein PpBr36_11236 [Pyricularia pennisetigena]|uniref:uncharacterized protein n=1 Tax=Pyricularia pennisetigena TaxID=1578925 RepID=UPI0011522626|nr:uncharacterized protein PpBr36_11236 [Pyricularia pennisetigena]TLS20566.1 hypothetical protein PpBr36_11236 [Pyricularia pennisetigena]
MQFNTIAVSLGLFALHASARPYCKVELLAKNQPNLNSWFSLQPAAYVLPGRPGRFKTAAYELHFETSADCRFIESETLTGTIENEEWKLQISRVNA